MCLDILNSPSGEAELVAPPPAPARCVLKREGGSHSLWTNPTTGAIEAVPRHTEIPNVLATKIAAIWESPNRALVDTAAPLDRGVRILPIERSGQHNPAVAVRPIAMVQPSHTIEVLPQLTRSRSGSTGMCCMDSGEIAHLPRASSPPRVPVVMSPSEVRLVIGQLTGVPLLVVSLLYGAGLRLQECLELRPRPARKRCP